MTKKIGCRVGLHEKKFYDTKPKYEIYFRKEDGKRWYRSGCYHWTKEIAEKDIRESNKMMKGKYKYKIKPYKGTWK